MNGCFSRYYYGEGLDEFIRSHSVQEILSSKLENDRWVFARRVFECRAIATVGYFSEDAEENLRMAQGEFTISRNHFKLFGSHSAYRGWYLFTYPHDPVYTAFRDAIPTDELAMGPVLGIETGNIAIEVQEELTLRSRRFADIKRLIFGSSSGGSLPAKTAEKIQPTKSKPKPKRRPAPVNKKRSTKTKTKRC